MKLVEIFTPKDIEDVRKCVFSKQRCGTATERKMTGNEQCVHMEQMRVSLARPSNSWNAKSRTLKLSL